MMCLENIVECNATNSRHQGSNRNNIEQECDQSQYRNQYKYSTEIDECFVFIFLDELQRQDQS